MTTALVLAGTATAAAAPAPGEPAPGSAGPGVVEKRQPPHASTHIRKAPPGLPRIKTGPLMQPKRMASTKSVRVAPRQAVAGEVDPIDLKILVISADGKEVNLPAIRSALDYMGTPYSVHIASQHPGSLTADKLYSGVHAFYQGVILATGSLVYFNGSEWVSALTDAEWQALWTFEGLFGIRQVSWYTYPTPDLGFTGTPTAVDTTGAPLQTTYTPEGANTFSHVNASNPLPIEGAYTYLAKPATDGNTTTLLSDAAGNALAAVRTYPEQANRQNLSLTFASNQYLIHNMVLSYGLIDWVTKGLHLGERHNYLKPQPDDVFIADTIWPVGTPCGTNPEDPSLPEYRITGDDLQRTLAWQQQKQAQPVSRELTIEMPFNGVGTVPGEFTPDTLTPAARQTQGSFDWVNHTWDHADLDSISYAAAADEIRQNNELAGSFPLTDYDPANLITPNISGLTNPDFLRAAADNGVRYLLSDTSRPGYDNPSPNTGIYNTFQPSILMIPRHPTNLYFNVTTPQEWLAEDNCIYPAGALGHVGSYAQLVDRESSVMLSYLLRGDVDPLMFHQPNLRAYDGTRSLLGDLVDRTMEKYSRLVTLPVLSPTMDEIGERMADRIKYNASGVTASIVPGESITLTAQKAATIPVTGLQTAGAELYGGKHISYVDLGAGQSVTLPLTQ